MILSSSPCFPILVGFSVDIMQYPIGPKVSVVSFGLIFISHLAVPWKETWRFQDKIQKNWRSHTVFLSKHYKWATALWQTMWQPNTYVQLCVSQYKAVLILPICICHLHLTLAVDLVASVDLEVNMKSHCVCEFLYMDVLYFWVVCEK